MEETLKISVVIPVYNTAEYLPRCLSSVLKNTYRNLEVICINDGSTDNSADILEKHAEEDPRVIVINRENGGVSSARNAGLDQSTGDYVAFVDSDDWVHPQYFEILTDLAGKYDADCAFCGTRSVDRDEEKSTILYANKSIQASATDLHSVMSNHFWRTRVWGRIYKKELVSGLRFPREIKLAEDTVFNLSALCFQDPIKVAAVDTKLYCYFQRQESAVHILPAKSFYPVLPLYEDIYKKCQSNQRIYIVEHIIKQALSLRYGTMFSEDKETYQKKCNKLLKSYIRVQNGLSTKQ